ncbi:hypothetical protein ACIBHY_52270 [Nonomuraea sp. NPDC050547]|uniref:hypothetical protein n=1 Tax=Nonomuraea sp. NPDC050547 TaxID=3364368 RepID=UPI0037A12EB2
MKTRFTAALAAGALALSLSPAAPAQAGPHDHDAVRYASLKGCADKKDERRPCGPWRLVTHDGGQRPLRDAQTVARHADGTSSGYQVAPIAVSGDGSHVAYFTKRGRLAVRTIGGGVKLLAADALPRVAQYDVTLLLSDDGAKLAAAITGKKTRIFDTASGTQVGSAGRGEAVSGFSGDADELLTSSEGEEPVTDLAVYRDSGEQVRRVTPPQVVAYNGPYALAADGATTANVIQGGKPALVLYDSAVDQVTAKIRLTLPKGEVLKADWTGENQVTLHLADVPESGPTKMTVVRVEVPSGKVTVRDRYSVLADSYVFAACGG